MELKSLFEAAGFDVPATHPAAGTAPVVSEDLLNLGIGILAAAVENGVDLPEALHKLIAARNIERAFNAVSTLRTQIIASADQAGAAEIDGLSMADVIAEERRIPKNAATSEIRTARSQAEFPNVLKAAAASRISQENLYTAVKTLEKMRPHYSQTEFPHVEAALLKEAETPVPGEFRKKCRTTLEMLDEAIRKANNAATAKRRKQSFQDRGLAITLIQDGEFGANLFAHIPAEYLRILMPALEKKAETIARAQRHSKARKAADRKTRLLDALFTTMTGHYPPEADDLTHLTGNDPDNGQDPTDQDPSEDLFDDEDPPDGEDPYDGPGPSGNDSGGSRPGPNHSGGNDGNGAEIEGPEADTFEDDTESLTDRIMADDDFTCGDTSRPSAATTPVATGTGAETAGLTPAPPAPPIVEGLTVAFPERSRHMWDTRDADRGRETRLASKKLRKLLALRDGGCVFPMCTDPPEGCVAHHIISWESGGPTNLTNLALVCSRHHPRVEKPPGAPNSWTIIIDQTGIPAARPPRRIDPDQQPMEPGPVYRTPVLRR